MLDESRQNNQPVIKELREFLGLSQEGLARLIGCSAKKLSRGENGVEISFTMAEIKNLEVLLKEQLGISSFSALPDKLSEPADLSHLLKSQEAK